MTATRTVRAGVAAHAAIRSSFAAVHSNGVPSAGSSAVSAGSSDVAVVELARRLRRRGGAEHRQLGEPVGCLRHGRGQRQERQGGRRDPSHLQRTTPPAPRRERLGSYVRTLSGG
jgi:hypothetical protein